MDKEVERLEALESSLREHQILLEAMQSIENDSDQSQADSLQELERLQRIVGDFHPGPASQTYRQLYDENQSLRTELQESNEKITEMQTRLTDAIKKIGEQEQEIMHLRNQPAQPFLKTVEQEKQLHRPKAFRRKAKQLADIKTDEERRDELAALLFSTRFSDGQVLLLADILNKDTSLPVSELCHLVDPRLSEHRIRHLYHLLCSKHHVEPAIECFHVPADENADCDQASATVLFSAEDTGSDSGTTGDILNRNKQISQQNIPISKGGRTR